MSEEKQVLLKIANLILDRTGIYIKEGQFLRLKNKLGRVMRDWKINDYAVLYEILLNSHYDEKFFDVVNEVSVNVTEFCRQLEHFLFLRDSFVREFLQEGPPLQTIRVWSAACSTGEEPYSIIMALLEGFRRNQATPASLQVTATDISRRSLVAAGEGVYELEQVKNHLPDQECLPRYFQEGFGKNRGQVKIKDFIKQMVRFQALNLNEGLPFSREFDIVFIRNVLIYFSREKQTEILRKVCATLKQDGYLFLGFSETARGLDLPLHYVQPALYKRF